MQPIPFNTPLQTGEEINFLSEVFQNGKFSGDQVFTQKCHDWFDTLLTPSRTLLTTSCTHALEMAALLLDIHPGDEVILPSFTFVSSANPFVLRGAKLVFVDIDPATMNMDIRAVSEAISPRTKAIVPVHYGGISCDIDSLIAVAKINNIPIIEDAAQAMLAKYKGRMLGTMGTMAVYSFHETKNYQCGEGGLIILNSPEHFETAEILREKGTNRAKFFRGEIDKYTWVSQGSSYLPSELNAAVLWAQLQMAEKVKTVRCNWWNEYHTRLMAMQTKGFLELQQIPNYAESNAHMFYIKLKDAKTRQKLIAFLKNQHISTAFHYVPLHSSQAGKKYGHFSGEDKWTTKESNRLLRLPLYFNLTIPEIARVCDNIEAFFK